MTFPVKIANIHKMMKLKKLMRSKRILTRRIKGALLSIVVKLSTLENRVKAGDCIPTRNLIYRAEKSFKISTFSKEKCGRLILDTIKIEATKLESKNPIVKSVTFILKTTQTGAKIVACHPNWKCLAQRSKILP